MLIPTSLTLPIPKILTDVAQATSWSTTVAPYLSSQIYELPAKFFSAVLSFDLSKVTQVYVQTNPLVFALGFAIGLAPVFLVVSEVNKNYSQVDRCWSILPTVYAAHYYLWANLAGLPTQRLGYVLLASCIWSTRLTYNYWRKGGYSVGSEDYRWEILRKYIPAPLFFVFNVAFISLAQSLLLWSITTPIYVLLLIGPKMQTGWDAGDMTFSRIMVTCTFISYWADQQQWDFHNAKAAFQKSGTSPDPAKYPVSDLKRGFLVRGLWSLSRHPNFAPEQAHWCALYGWAAFQTRTWYSWPIVGALGYLCLFQASTWFTELVSAGKYEAYKAYQRGVPMFVPKPWTILNSPFGPREVVEEGKGKGKESAGGSK